MEAAMGDPSSPSNYKDFALSGKIMLSAIIILLFVVILIICLHLYARWYVLRARRRGNLHSNRRRNRFVFFVESDNNNAPPFNHTPSNPGLDAEILKSLPVFVFGSKTDSDSDPIECAVCLSEFEENEKGRKLPTCSHCFHIDCIDMWFHSHSTCPLCRSPVEPLPVSQCVVEAEPEMIEPGSSSTGSTSFRARRKPVELAGVSIEIPRRFDAEFAVSGTGFSPSTSTPLTPSFKSPISRVMSLSFKRIIGRDRRGGCSPSGAGSSATEPDIERGKSVL